MAISDLKSILPESAVAATAILILLVDISLPRRVRALSAYLALLGLLLVSGVSLSLWGSREVTFQGALLLDNFGLLLNLVFCLAAGLSILMAERYLTDLGISGGEYYSLTLFATLGAMLMAAGGDLLTIFLGLEILSLSLYILAGFRRREARSQEAALKYLLLGAFASGFLLYGIALVLGATGTTNLGEIASFLGGSMNLCDPLLLLALGLLAVGFGFKVALVPFHMWTPDVYEGAPTPVAAYMSVAAKAAGFAVIFRLFFSAFPSLHQVWIWLFAALSVVTMTVGNIVALTQSNIKRLLAYSTIAHAGYLLLAVVAASDWAVASALYYLLAYAFMNLGAFAVVVALREGEREYLALDDYAGLGFQRPFLAAAMALFLLSLTGIPPTAGFLAKVYLFGAAVQAGYPWLVVIAVLNSVVAAYYYLRVLVIMYMREPAKEKRAQFAPLLALAILIAVWGSLQLGLLPSPFLQLVRSSILSMGGF